ncbi:hypothetical protein Tco_1062449, partial [Tanacetum coccineum]
MAGSLMYLAASRPDLVFVVCMCARYQAKSTKKHLEVIKRVFRYLRSTINLGLWYPKDIAMALTAYADADHEGCHDTRIRYDDVVLMFSCDPQSLVVGYSLDVNGLPFDIHASDKMAEENVPTPTPTRSDEQILPFNAWLPVRKGNLLLDLHKLQKNPIFRISDAKTRVYSFQLDKQWFTLNYDLLHKALEITHVDSAHPFESPPAGEQVMDFVNELGYPKAIHFVSKMHVIPKVEKDEFFRKPILQKLITKAIQNLPYYQQYLEMVARKPTAKKGGQKKIASKANKPKKPAMAKQPALAEQIKLRTDHLVDEEDEEPQPAPEIPVEDDEYNLQRGIQMSLESFQAPVSGVAIREPTLGITQRLPVVEGKGKGIATDDQ